MVAKDNPKCEEHAKVEYRLEELTKAVDRQATKLDAFKKEQEGAMAEIKKELQRVYNEFLDSKRNPKLLIAIIGFFGVAFSAAGSVIGSLIIAYFKATGGTP